MQHHQWLIAGRSMCELGIRTLRDAIEDDPEMGREPLVIEAHTALVVALGALDTVGAGRDPEALEAARAAVGRAQQSVARARAAIDSLRSLRSAERSG